MSSWLTRCVHSVTTRPYLCIVIAGLMATIWAMYPIVFFSRSMVSPSFSTWMLYEKPPFLPHYHDYRIWSALGSDIGAEMWQNLPYSFVQSRSVVGHGEIPFWNRYNAGGRPLIGQGQSSFFDPIHWLTILGEGQANTWDLKFFLGRLIFAVGVGFLAMAVTGHLPAAVASTVIAPFCGYFLYRYNHPAYFSLTYTPWIILFAVRIIDRKYAWQYIYTIVALSIATALEIFGSPPKEAFSVLSIAYLIGFFAIILTPVEAARRIQASMGILGAAALALLLTAPHWLVFLETWASGATPYDAPGASVAHVSQLVGYFFGVLSGAFVATNGLAVIPATNIYNLAMLAWAFAKIKVLGTDRLFMAFVLGFGVSIFLAFGVIPPSVISSAPLLRNIIHVSDTYTCAAVVPMLILGAFGFREMWKSFGAVDWLLNHLMIFILCLVAILGISFFGQSHAILSLKTIVLVSSSALVFLALFLLREIVTRRKVAPSRKTALAVLFIAIGSVPLIPFGLNLPLGQLPRLFTPGDRPNLFSKSDSIEYIKAATSSPVRVIGADHDLIPGVQDIYGLEGISGPDALFSPGMDRLVKAAFPHSWWGWDIYLTANDLPAVNPFLDMFGVRFILTSDWSRFPQRSEDRVVHSGDLTVVERSTAWPRAFFVATVHPYDHLNEFLELVRRNCPRPFAALNRDDLDKNKAIQTLVLKSNDEDVTLATDYRLTPNSTSFTITTQGRGLIVLMEAYWPSSEKVYVNGRSVSPLLVNEAFIGVPVSERGELRVEVVYRPAAWDLAIILSACGLVALICLSAVSIVQRRNSRPHP